MNDVGIEGFGEPPAKPQSVPAEGWIICIKSERYDISAERCGCVKCRRELATLQPAKTEGWGTC